MPPSQNLAGTWRFALDPDNVGVAENWFARPLAGSVRLPGDLAGQGIGNPVTFDTPWTGKIKDRSYFTAPEYAPYREPDNIKVPFWLQPDLYYAGAAWYQRDIDIPAAWENHAVQLSLERPHIVTRVWLDDREIGSADSLATPHVYDFGSSVSAGRHRLTIRVDNLCYVDVGVNSHSVSDHTQGNWNGIVGHLELRSLGFAWIDDLQLHADAATRSVRLTGRVAGTPATPVRLEIAAAAASPAISILAQPNADGVFHAELALGDSVQLWDEFNPALYTLVATPLNGTPRRSTFGFRELGRSGAQLTINGRKLFLRGALDCAIFPKTGHPPTDLDSWKRLLGIAREWGLNHIRYHSWCPPEAAFVAADELGIYLQIECSSWANASVTLGDGLPVDDWIYAEADRILKTYGNHPSFVLMTYGNEPGGPNHPAYLSKWVAHHQARDPRRLYASAAGWPTVPENDFHNDPEPRIYIWGSGLGSRINAFPPATTADYTAFTEKRYQGTPVVTHEIGQWCAYPNLDEIPKYTGVLKAKNFEIFRETLAAHHIADQARDFLIASGKHQTLVYKEEIESTLRTTNISGFQLLGLQDFPGQGTAPVGVLDAFWEPKGYVTASEYRRFCDVTVLLARLAKRVFTTDETFTAAIEVAHFGASPIKSVSTFWRLVSDDGHILASGELPAATIPVDNGTPLGAIALDLADIPAPQRCKLVVSLADGRTENDWDLWIYPPKVNGAAPPGVTVVERLDETACAALAAGERVLWLIPPGDVANDPKRPITPGFSPIFWNTSWTTNQPPTTLGILCDPQAPALAEFPTDAHSNWQWWYVVTRATPMILDHLPASLRPVVQVIDDWFANRKLGLVFEARVGPGRLLACSIDLTDREDASGSVNPVIRQLRASLLRYAASDDFDPKTTLAIDQARAVIRSQPHLKV
ncbi:MAG: sugar-binding domain-containing protein [Verrucomicrobiota bacterium]